MLKKGSYKIGKYEYLAFLAEDWWWLLVITGVAGTLGVFGFGLRVVVVRRAVVPIAQLAKVVAEIDLEHLSAEGHKRIESSRFGDDEVGAPSFERKFVST